MANIGDKVRHKHLNGYEFEILDITNRGYKVRERILTSRSKKYREAGGTKYYYHSEMTQREQNAEDVATTQIFRKAQSLTTRRWWMT